MQQSFKCQSWNSAKLYYQGQTRHQKLHLILMIKMTYTMCLFIRHLEKGENYEIKLRLVLRNEIKFILSYCVPSSGNSQTDGIFVWYKMIDIKILV